MSEIGINKKSADINNMMKKHTPNNVINSVYEFTAKNTHVGYDSWQRGGGAKSHRTWDCSELSARTIKNMFSDMRDCDVNFKTNFKQLERAFPNHSTTVSQRQALDAMDVPKVTGKSAVMKDLEVGMLIYSRYPTKKGTMGHVATVSRDPSSGDLVISESNGSAGVTHRSINSFFNSGVGARPTTQWVRYNPLHKDRPLLRQMDKEAQDFLDVYQKAERAYAKEVHSPYRKVGARVPSKERFIDDYLERNFDSMGDFSGKQNKVQPSQNNTYGGNQRVAFNQNNDKNNTTELSAAPLSESARLLQLLGLKALEAMTNNKNNGVVPTPLLNVSQNNQSNQTNANIDFSFLQRVLNNNANQAQNDDTIGNNLIKQIKL